MEAQQEQPAPTVFSHAIKHGIILGCVSIVMIVLAYVVDVRFMASLKFLTLSLLVTLGYVIYAGITYRNEIGGFLGYSTALQHGFILMAISGIVGTVFNLVLYNVVDPDLPQKMTDAIIQNTEETMAGFGAPQQSIDETLEGMKTKMAEQFGVSGLLMGYLKGLIYFLVIALITSLFVRKNEPLEA